MAIDTSSYDLLKKSKLEEALNKKNNAISSLQTQQTGIENTYKDLADTLAKRKADLAAKNTADNQNLDSQLQTGTENYMQQRDQGVIANTNQTKAIQDWYAKNNIANSTASADELGRQATTLANTLGTINSNKNSFETGITNNRNLVNLDYSNGVNDLVNQDNAAQREKAQKLAEILNLITGANSAYDSEAQSINDSVEAEKLKAINDYNEQLRQEAVKAAEAERDRQFQAQQASLSRSSSSNTSSAKAQKEQATNQAWSRFNEEFKDGTADQYLQQYGSDIINTLGYDVYNEMVNQLAKNKTVFANTQNLNNKINNVSNDAQSFKLGGSGRMLLD